MNKLLDFLIVFFSAVIAFSIGVIVAFHPSTKEITNKKYVEIDKKFYPCTSRTVLEVPTIQL